MSIIAKIINGNKVAINGNRTPVPKPTVSPANKIYRLQFSFKLCFLRYLKNMYVDQTLAKAINGSFEFIAMWPKRVGLMKHNKNTIFPTFLLNKLLVIL